MTDSVKPNEADEIAVIEAPSEPQVSTLPPVNQVSHTSTSTKSGRGLSIVAILFSIAALGASAYSFYQYEIQGKYKESRLELKLVEADGKISRLDDKFANLQIEQSKAISQEQLTTRLLEKDSAVDLRFRDVTQSQNELNNAITKINQDLSRGANDFVVAEVAQLLKLANNSALFSNNADSAIKALQLADLQLKELADPRYSVVRSTINQEISALQGVEQLDLESLSVKLQTLSEKIPSLELENDVPTLGEVVIETEVQPQGFVAGLKEMWADIVNYNSVQRIDQAPKPLLLPEQRYFLNQNIQLQLAKAELAVLQGRETTFKQSLASALNWLREYFNPRDQNVIDLISELEALESLSLSQQLPSISGSYSELQNIRGGQ